MTLPFGMEAPVIRHVLATGLLVGLPALHASTFTDSFNLPDGSTPTVWGNEIGDWRVHDGQYDATAGGAYPNAHSLLPWRAKDLTLELDTTTNGVGGVWLHAANAPGTAVGVTGVLFVLDSYYMYFYEVTNPGVYGVQWYSVWRRSGPHHLRISVTGNQYTVVVDPGTPYAVTMIYFSNAFPRGQTGLFDSTGLGFDNVRVTMQGMPEPASWGLTLAGAAALGAFALRRRA